MSESLTLYQVDAFAGRVFAGNPAAVCPLDAWLEDDLMQAIATENNLSETAYFVEREDGDYHLRWFTPAKETPLCGHATLASASVVFDHLRPDASEVRFHTLSGELIVTKDGDRLTMNFPALPADEVPMPDGLIDALGAAPLAFLRAVKNMAVLEDEQAVRAVDRDLAYIADMEGMGLIVTAPGDNSDCASRYFAPHVGIPEDPVTGSAHCTIVPYWAARLGRPDIHARQVSARGGELFCALDGKRVSIAGTAVPYMEARMHLP